MLSIRDEFGLAVGYSDHTLGSTAAITAVALGATMIEKHFTLDKNQAGPDHRASLEPDELKSYVQAIRDVASSLGDGVKAPSASERKNIDIARKSIVAAQRIRKGETLSVDNMTFKRPGTGRQPAEFFDLLGTPASRDYEEDEQI